MNWQETVNVLLQPALLTLIQVLVPALLGLAIPWLLLQIKRARAKLAVDELALIDNTISQFVNIAEANGLIDAALKEGAAKKQYVLAAAQAYLDKRGIKVDAAFLEKKLEEAVWQAFNRYKELPAQ